MKFINKIFCLDIRSLALFRIVLGIANLACAYSYLSYTRALILTEGVIPPKFIARNKYYLSLFDINESNYFHLALFCIFVFAAICFTLGFKTKLCSAILYLLTLSIENRYSICGGVAGLRMGLFWSFFLPLNRVRFPTKGNIPLDNYQIVSLASICFFLKICTFYFVAFLQKDYNDWFSRSFGLYSSLWLGGMGTRFGEILRSFPGFCFLLNRYIYLLEFFAPLMLLVSFNLPILRVFAVGNLLLMHAGILLTMNIEEFSIANFAMACAFIPSHFWNYISKRKNNMAPLVFSFNRMHLIPVIFLSMIWIKHLYVLKVTNFYPSNVVTVLRIFKMDARWDMFKGGGRILTYWPILIAKTADGKVFDIWRWYLGLDPKKNLDIKKYPEDAISLTPSIRWEKYISSLIFYHKLNRRFHAPFVEFLCREYNLSLEGTENPVLYVRFLRGSREVYDFDNFSTVSNKDFGRIKCVSK